MTVCGHIYVLSYDNGMVKVGRSRNPGGRLNAHKANARNVGLTVTDSWVSPLHREWIVNEEYLKRAAANLGGVPQSAEVFSNVDFAVVVKRARTFPFTEPDPEPKPADALSTAPLRSVRAMRQRQGPGAAAASPKREQLKNRAQEALVEASRLEQQALAARSVATRQAMEADLIEFAEILARAGKSPGAIREWTLTARDALPDVAILVLADLVEAEQGAA